MANRAEADFDSILEDVKTRAKERTPKRQVNRWIRTDPPPAGTVTLLVNMTAEDIVEARRFAEDRLVPMLVAKQSFALDFRSLEVCTQSYLHALLYEVLRLAWPRRVCDLRARCLTRSADRDRDARELCPERVGLFPSAIFPLRVPALFC